MQNTSLGKTESKLDLEVQNSRKQFLPKGAGDSLARSVVLDLLQVQVTLVQREDALFSSTVPVTGIPTAPALTLTLTLDSLWLP